MTFVPRLHEARQLRLSSVWLRVPLGVVGAMSIALATYETFGPLSDARAWRLAGVHDAGVSGAAGEAIRLGASPATPRLAAGTTPPDAVRAIGPRQRHDVVGAAS